MTREVCKVISNGRRWKASVSFLAPRPEDSETVHYGLFEAADRWAAAGFVAKAAALFRYPTVGERGFLTQDDDGKFRAAIGYPTRKHPEILVGCTVLITIERAK